MEENSSLILFYHPQSKACEKLKGVLKELSQELQKKMQFVNIDELQNIPPSITNIPALVINNKDVLLGKAVFDYFNKKDEMEFISFGNKHSGLIANGSFLDSDNIESNSMFSSIDAPSISEGVPEFNDNDEGKSFDLNKLQEARSQEFNAIKRE
tara:strand:+ start:26 stop:487 length:462 start_codon:yes stop_codon:yes gene_type:complete